MTDPAETLNELRDYLGVDPATRPPLRRNIALSSYLRILAKMVEEDADMIETSTVFTVLGAGAKYMSPEGVIIVLSSVYGWSPSEVAGVLSIAP